MDWYSFILELMLHPFIGWGVFLFLLVYHWAWLKRLDIVKAIWIAGLFRRCDTCNEMGVLWKLHTKDERWRTSDGLRTYCGLCLPSQ